MARSAPSPRGRLTAALLFLVLLLPVGATPTEAMMPALVQDEDGLQVALDSMRQLATDSRSNKEQRATTRPRRGLPVTLGRDGRLTVLLIGSDWRPDSLGERLDVLMVATIDPETGMGSLVSVPRDMSGIPFAGGGNSGGMPVNSVYFIRYRDPSLPHAGLDRKGLKRFSRDVGALLGTEVDHWALTRFSTFANLINALGGVRLDVDEEVLDSSYHHGSSRGVWFPVARDYKLKGDPKCKPKPRKCHSALVYARSRKGTMGGEFNSDWRRAERQQDIVRASIRQVVEQRGAGLGLLGTLLHVRDLIETDIPKTAEAAAQLFALLEKLRLPASNMKVLAPATWAGTTADGRIVPNLSAIRRWVDTHFYRVNGRRARD
jgi:anionic cell wall polymer biosynthesis LytR-Cps2A-Psr (LCP) family protein